MTRNETELRGVLSLGQQKTKYELNNPTKDILETFGNMHQNNDYLVDFSCPEFSSLCPKTLQPDFATIYIRYVPRIQMVESKSLKLYLFAYRNHGDFHEDCTNKIMKDLRDVMDPKWLRVIGDFTPRGGIAITTIAEHTAKDYIPPAHYLQLPISLHTRHGGL